MTPFHYSVSPLSSFHSPFSKAENPKASKAHVSKLLSQRWKDLSEDDKAPYLALAKEKKSLYKNEIEAGGGLKPSINKAGNAVRVKSSFELFSLERRPELRKANPKAANPEIEALVKSEWVAMSNENKKVYAARRKQLKEEAAAQFAEGDNHCSDGEQRSIKKKRATPTVKTPGGKKSKRSKTVDIDEKSENQECSREEVPRSSRQGSRSRPCGVLNDQDEDEEDDDIDRENVDWEAHPAVAILSKTRGGKYIVARHGLPLHKYGEVSVALAAAHRSGLAAKEDPSCPLLSEMLDDFEAFNRTFKRDVYNNTEDGELDLDPERLQAGTKLESCAFLGFLREPGHELSSVDRKADVWMKVPMMATSRLVQRMIDVKLMEAETVWKAQLDALKAEVRSFKMKMAGEEIGNDTVAGAEV